MNAGVSEGRSPPRLTFLMIVDDAEIARFVHDSGVDRLFVDLEYIGKDARQGKLDTWKSRQTLSDVSRIREAVPSGHLLVRVNPMHEGTLAEVEEVLSRGADSVMLPMFRTQDELKRFADIVNGRAEVLPLVETADALRAVPEICDTVPIGRLHFGLNDLHLDLGLRFMFQPLVMGLLDDATAALRTSKIPFGIGGLARVGEGLVSPEFLLGEHVRLGSDAAILSRTLHRRATSLDRLRDDMDFPEELKRLRAIFARFHKAGTEEIEENRVETTKRILEVVESMRRTES